MYISLIVDMSFSKEGISALIIKARFSRFSLIKLLHKVLKNFESNQSQIRPESSTPVPRNLIDVLTFGSIFILRSRVHLSKCKFIHFKELLSFLLLKKVLYKQVSQVEFKIF